MVNREAVPSENSDHSPWSIIAEGSSEMPPSQNSETTETKNKKEKSVPERNFERLKRYYGESFVKDAEGYNARTLAAFAEDPSFYNVLKTIIPNKHDALQTLRDNFDYINATLISHYEETGIIEKETPKDPYELAKRAGFELTGPFDDAAEFAQYKKDFRPSERICTYNDPDARLRAYHILWLRHTNADNVRPADELTTENLTDEWKQYLRENHRYDANTDTYNLDDLRPMREDPYGTSSMSVQISRYNTDVSIKNRYNHTVNFPDNTLNSDLNKLADGLKLAVYHEIGREELLELTNTGLHEGYVRDNNGGIHKYFFEEDNVYYGWYEKIENGEVTSLPENEYYMLSPQLYLHKNNREVAPLIKTKSKKFNNAEIEHIDNSTKIRLIDKHGKLLMTYEITLDPENKTILELSLSITKEPTIYDIHDNPALTSIYLAEGAGARYIYHNPALEFISLAEGALAWNIHDNPALTSIYLAEGAQTEDIYDNPALSSISLAEGAQTEDIHDNPALTSIYLAEGAGARYIYDNPALTSINLAKGAKTGDIDNNSPQLVVTRNDRENGELENG